MKNKYLNKKQIKKISEFYKIPSYGFTLAEVLITLGIIGVVAAITIPSLINNYQQKVYDTSYAKAKSNLINGFKLLLAMNNAENIDNLDASNCGNDENCYRNNLSSAFKIVRDNNSGLSISSLPEKYTVPSNYTPSIMPAATMDPPEEAKFDWSDVPYVFQMADGITYGIEYINSTNGYNIYVDTNSSAKPNQVAKDLYKFRVLGNASLADVTHELPYFNGYCSASNRNACTTAEQCRAAAAERKTNGVCPPNLFSQSSAEVSNGIGSFGQYGCYIYTGGLNSYWSSSFCP